MPSIKIEGNNRLSGEIKVSGAKNSAVALIPASILCDEKVEISNVPNISDIDALEEILNLLGADVNRDGEHVVIDCSNTNNVDMCFPGGCTIGKRPIDLHLKGFEKLGAEIIDEDDHFIIKADKLIGDNIYLDVPSVGATINIMFAAVKAKGKTVIENAAMEPEIVNVAMLLNNMGAKITGAGTSVITIVGVKRLHKCIHEVIPDRIEAGTFVIMGALLGDNLKVSRLIPSHIESLTSKLEEIGVEMEIGEDYVIVNSNNIGNYEATDIKTLVYPGFPTDLQQIIVPLLTQCNGISHVEETIYENRFQNIDDTVKMGASIDVYDNRVATIIGKTKLSGMNVSATDLRGGASMLVCGLIAEGETIIDNVDYILRGYSDIVGKLGSVGAKIEFID